MLKIHYHSDCPFFAGCENMLINFFNSERLKKNYEISFSYRQSVRYTQGFRQRVAGNLSTYPVTFLDLSDYTKLASALPLIGRRIIMAFFRLLLIYPVLCYEIFVLYRLFKKIGPDILHINNGGYPAALSARAAAVAGMLAKVPKIVMVVNNMAVNYRHFFRWMDYPIDRIVVHAVNRFITGSVAASDQLKKILSLPSSKLVTIHNGISMRQATASLSATRDRLGLSGFDGVIFGVVALLIPRKGHQVLLEAVLKLVSEVRFMGMGLKILIEGDGPLKAQLVNFVASNDLSQWVTFVGDEANIVDFMSVLDVLILPSVQDEDFPNVILEAMALGKPVIASRLAGTPEQIVDGVTGLLVEPRNIGQLADAIGFLIESADVRIKMGLAALDRFDGQFTSSKSLNNYMDMYQQLTKEAQ